MKKNQTDSENYFKQSSSQTLQRTIALWAFSESAFGGILHAVKIPFRGIFISSAAVLFISIIVLSGKTKREILKATLIVILVKAVVSPHSPITAYFAVSLQGFLGFLFFPTKKFFKLSAFLLGMSALFFSGIQKISMLTIVFGNTLWESVDIFIRQTSFELFNINHPEINYGYLFITAYVLIHLCSGVIIGLYAAKLPQKINYYKNIIPSSAEFKNEEEIPFDKSKKSKNWFLRPTGISIISLSIGVIIISYLTSEFESNVSVSIMIMFVRAIVITFAWYLLIAPLMRKYFQKFAAKMNSEYAKDLEEIISMFPHFRMIVSYCWKNSIHKRGLGRIKTFLSTSFYYLLLSE